MSVLFHGSFGLNRQHMSGLTALALQKPRYKDKDLAKPFGYGAPFGQRTRSWLHKCGVAEMGLPLRLTESGEILVRRDPKFESLAAQWFLHHELVTDPERSEAWHFFAKKFLPNHTTFTKQDLLDGLTEKLRYHSEQHFGPGSKLNRTILRKIIEVYTADAGLGRLALLQFDGIQFKAGKPKVLGPWKSVAAFEKALS